MQIIIPMAGHGYRFLREGYQDPKPLIPIDGKPIIEHIVGLFPGEHDFIFICNFDHLAHTNMRAELTRIKPQGQIVGILPHQLGPVHTVLSAEESINDSKPTIVSYCDIFLDWDFTRFQKEMQEQRHDACLVCFKNFHPPLAREGFYATIRTKKNNPSVAAEVREKYSFTANKMDSWNSAGVHYFKSGGLMKKYFQALKDRRMTVNEEYYVSMAHNLMIKDGWQNGIYPVEYFISWGKPTDVREYLYWSKHFNHIQNPDEN